MGSAADEHIAELRKQEQQTRERAIAIAKETIEVFGTDLPLFVEREVKRAFVADPDFAESLDDDAIRALKDDVRDQALAAAAQVLESLGDWELWLRGYKHVEGAKSFEDHLELWDTVCSIGAPVEKILSAHGFPAGAAAAEGLRYRQPKWFINGKLLTTLAEKYWRAMAELASVRAELEALDLQHRREALKQRWDAVR